MAVAEPGNGWFHKPLDYDMCAASRDIKTEKEGEKSFASKSLPSSEGTCSSSRLETAETVDINWNWWSKRRLMELMDEIVASSPALRSPPVQALKDKALMQPLHGACQMWYYGFKSSACLLLHSEWPSRMSAAGKIFCWAWLIVNIIAVLCPCLALYLMGKKNTKWLKMSAAAFEMAREEKNK